MCRIRSCFKRTSKIKNNLQFETIPPKWTLEKVKTLEVFYGKFCMFNAVKQMIKKRKMRKAGQFDMIPLFCINKDAEYQI